MIRTSILPDHAAMGNHIEVLHDIHLRTKSIAVYQRGIQPLKEDLVQAAQKPIAHKASGTLQDIRDSFEIYFAHSEHLNERLLEDALFLLGLFKEVTGMSSFRMALTTLSHTMCPRFHADHNELRMLCTYAGPGTLWLPNHAVNRRAYQRGKSNEKIVPDESLVQQADAGDVLILKGALYPGATPILHRSPGIEDESEERILLSIDLNESLVLPKGAPDINTHQLR